SSFRQPRPYLPRRDRHLASHHLIHRPTQPSYQPPPKEPPSVQPAPALPSPATDPTLPRLNGLPVSPDHHVVLDEGRGHLVDSLRAWKVKVATAGLWVLIALAGAGGLRALVWKGSPAAASLPAAAPAGVAGFAEMYVAAYLEAGAGQEQTLRSYYPAAV